MTLTELREFSNLKLASESDITAIEHREVNNAILDFIQTMLPLAKGSFSIGDVVGDDNIRTITFPDIATDNYKVIGGLVYLGTNYNQNNDVIAMTGEYTRTSFKIALRELSHEVQDLRFDWEIKLKS
jgi:hypothetical protein